MRIDNLFTKDTSDSEVFIFSLPAFALMGNWNFGQHFIPTANTPCTHLQNPQSTLKSLFCKRVQLALPAFGFLKVTCKDQNTTLIFY